MITSFTEAEVPNLVIMTTLSVNGMILKLQSASVCFFGLSHYRHFHFCQISNSNLNLLILSILEYKDSSDGYKDLFIKVKYYIKYYYIVKI